tara:strand:+ start:2444 stop:3964 length:1521 start_codon:yes stop_codon:yes gene_type:complete
MTVIRFGEWLPDQPSFDARDGVDLAPYCLIAKNAVPHILDYSEFPQQAAFSSALTARCQGAAGFVAADGTPHLVAGDATKLYRFADTTATDASKAGGYTIEADQMWRFLHWGADNRVFAFNISDAVQVASLSSSLSFSDLFTSTLKPKARYGAIIKNHLVLANVDEGGTLYPTRVRWSAIADPSDMDANTTNYSGAIDLKGEYGWIQGITGGEYGLVLRDRGIHRLVWTGLPDIFNADDVLDENVGLWAPHSLQNWKHLTFFLSDSGLKMHDGAQVHDIGASKIDRWLTSNIDVGTRVRASSAIDPDNKLYLLAFPSKNSSNGHPDLILLYDWIDRRFAYAEPTNAMEIIFRSITTGYTLEELDAFGTLESLGFSFDSRVFHGGQVQVSCFLTSHRMYHFTGNAETATFETADQHFFPGYRAQVNAFRPLVVGSAGAAVRGAMGVRNNLISESASFATSVSPSTSGECFQLAEGRYHRFRASLAGGFRSAQGVEVINADVSNTGDR